MRVMPTTLTITLHVDEEPTYDGPFVPVKTFDEQGSDELYFQITWEGDFTVEQFYNMIQNLSVSNVVIDDSEYVADQHQGIVSFQATISTDQYSVRGDGDDTFSPFDCKIMFAG